MKLGRWKNVPRKSTEKSTKKIKKAPKGAFLIGRAAEIRTRFKSSQRIRAASYTTARFYFLLYYITFRPKLEELIWIILILFCNSFCLS